MRRKKYLCLFSYDGNLYARDASCYNAEEAVKECTRSLAEEGMTNALLMCVGVGRLGPNEIETVPKGRVMSISASKGETYPTEVYQVWINHYMYDGWSASDPQWEGRGFSANYAANSAAEWFLANVGVNTTHLNEPLTVRVYEPYTKRPTKYYRIKIKTDLEAHPMIEEVKADD